MRRLSKRVRSVCVTLGCLLALWVYSSLDIRRTLGENSAHEPITSEIQDGLQTGTAKQAKSKRMNVLFLMSDDLRPQINAYRGTNAANSWGDVRMVTPHLDQLAERSLLLERAYVQISTCGPSRASILTGRRPDTTKVWTQKEYWRIVGGNFTTIPQYFKDSGYITAGLGKIFHPRKASGKDDPMSWTDPYYHPPDKRYWRKLGVSWRSFTKEELAIMPHPDSMIADAAIQKLREFAPKVKENNQNFFMGVGFLKPHLPFTFPYEYLQHYPIEEMDTARNRYLPTGYPPAAFSKPGELLAKSDIATLDFSGAMNDTLPSVPARELRRAYFACVTFIDHLVGKVLKELKSLSLDDNTIVSFIGDHGWHLGENGMWGKHTNMEQGTHTPMMLHIPGKTEAPLRSASIVEFVDLFPTLAEAAGLPEVPPCPKNGSSVLLCTEGVSFLPLVTDPSHSTKDAAFSQHILYRNPGMGYSIRTERFRYTEWARFERTKHRYRVYDYDILWDSLVGVELYDHHIDPEENINRALEPGYRGYRKELSDRLHEQISSAILNVQKPFD